MSDVVLDSSAVLAFLQAEPGSEPVAAALPGALISAVNLAEVVAKLAERGMPANAIRAVLEGVGLVIVDFNADQAWDCGGMRVTTRPWGLSLGDRACLALARDRGWPAITADAAWARVDGVKVVVIR